MQVNGKTKLPHPDMRDRKQVTVKMTEQFAQDLNLLFAAYGLTDLSYVVRESVSAQADYVRRDIDRRMAERDGKSSE